MAEPTDEILQRDLRNYLRVSNLDGSVKLTIPRLPIEYDRVELKKIINTEFEEFTK